MNLNAVGWPFAILLLPDDAEQKLGYWRGSEWWPYLWVKNIPGAFKVSPPTRRWPLHYYHHLFTYKFARLLLIHYPKVYCALQGIDTEDKYLDNYKAVHDFIVASERTGKVMEQQKTWFNFEALKAKVDFGSIEPYGDPERGYMEFSLNILLGPNSIIRSGNRPVIHTNVYFETRNEQKGWSYYMDYRTPQTYRTGGRLSFKDTEYNPDQQVSGWKEMYKKLRRRLVYLFKKRRYLTSGEFMKGSMEIENFNRIMENMISAINEQFVLHKKEAKKLAKKTA